MYKSGRPPMTVTHMRDPTHRHKKFVSAAIAFMLFHRRPSSLERSLYVRNSIFGYESHHSQL
ncbi:hypothetical protein OF83DRAFT_1146629 [Amylostereum chailletii]|nr:hypothetical protein OF83DRAFT_1146629 [Amylostereum chailletii]